jgi:ubiquinone/menaquinone biosynthesis C-methylase UbiE
MSSGHEHICPVERAGILDSLIRTWLQNPRRLLKPHLKEGMTALDFGCGPGFFSIEMARMIGESGRVIAADLQEGMLQKLKAKLQGTELGKRITLHKCGENAIGLSQRVDFVLAFYVLHELPDQEAFFREIGSLLNPGGRILVVEPPFHVSRAAFEETIKKSRSAGLTQIERPKVPFSKAVLLGMAQQ